MTDQEALDFYNELKEHFGDKLPNFEHYPKMFSYYVRLYRYYKTRSNEAN